MYFLNIFLTWFLVNIVFFLKKKYLSLLKQRAMLCFARHYSKLVQVGCLEEYSFPCHVDVFNHFTPSPLNVNYYDCARVRMSASLFSVSDDFKSTAATPPPGPSIKLVAPKHQLANPEPLNSITWPHIDCQYIPWLGAMVNIVHFRFQDLLVVEDIFLL